MSARIVVHCDRVHPERTPPACRAFLATSTAYVDPAYEEAEAAGWTQDVGNIDACPSCSQTADDDTCTGCGREVSQPGLCHDCDVEASYVGGLAPRFGAQP